MSVLLSKAPSMHPSSSNEPSKEEIPQDATTDWATENKGTVIGIALGVFFFVLILIFLALRRRRRNLRQATYYRPSPFPVSSQESPGYGYDTRIDDSSVAVEVMHHDARAY
jgi:hypothetical protein